MLPAWINSVFTEYTRSLILYRRIVMHVLGIAVAPLLC